MVKEVVTRCWVSQVTTFYPEALPMTLSLAVRVLINLHSLTPRQFSGLLLCNVFAQSTVDASLITLTLWVMIFEPVHKVGIEA